MPRQSAWLATVGNGQLISPAQGSSGSMCRPRRHQLLGPDVTSVPQITGGGQIGCDYQFSGVTSLWGGTGADTVIGSDGTNAWILTAFSKGTINTTLTFNKMENLTGGLGKDTFAFQAVLGHRND